MSRATVRLCRSCWPVRASGDGLAVAWTRGCVWAWGGHLPPEPWLLAPFATHRSLPGKPTPGPPSTTTALAVPRPTRSPLPHRLRRRRVSPRQPVNRFALRGWSPEVAPRAGRPAHPGRRLFGSATTRTRSAAATRPIASPDTLRGFGSSASSSAHRSRQRGAALNASDAPECPPGPA